MKGHKSLLILTVLALLAFAVPSALARGGGGGGGPTGDGNGLPGLWFSGSGVWDDPCNTVQSNGLSEGYVWIQANLFVPINFAYSVDWSFLSSSWGDNGGTITFIEDVGWIFNGAWGFAVPSDGSQTQDWEVTAPNGQLLTTVEASASCLTGVITVKAADIYGINDPAANQRVMATVLKDTPVYPTSAAVNPTSATLKAGQTWFVVGQVTGADGAVWYEVYVGGPVTGFVPAATLSLSGPVPAASYHGTSADPAPIPLIDLSQF